MLNLTAYVSLYMSFVSENLQEMSTVHSTDRYTLIKQLENHKNTLIGSHLIIALLLNSARPHLKLNFR